MELGDFLTYHPVMPIPILSHGLMYTGSRVILYGKYKSLKSMLAMNLALMISRGERWLSYDSPIGGTDVMYLQLEIPNPMLQSRLLKMVAGRTKLTRHAKMWIWTEPSLKLDMEIGFTKLDDMLTKYKPKVLIIDPVYKVVSGDLLSTQHIQKFVDWVDILVDRHQLSVILVHHTRKGAYEEWGSDDMLGSVIFSAWADTIMKVERRHNTEIVVRFDVVRHATEELPPRIYDVDLNTLSFIDTGRTL